MTSILTGIVKELMEESAGVLCPLLELDFSTADKPGGGPRPGGGPKAGLLAIVGAVSEEPSELLDEVDEARVPKKRKKC